MILELFVHIMVGMMEFTLTRIPASLVVAVDVIRDMFSMAVNLIQVASVFLPMDIIVIALGNILIWQTAHFTVSIARFILDFMPFF